MLVSSRLTLSLVIQHHNFGWSPHHLSFPQSFGTYIFVDLQTTYSSHSHLLHNTTATLGYIYNPLTPEESLSIMEKAFFQLVWPEFALSQEVTGSNSNQQAQKKPETIFQDFQPFAIACVRGCCVPVARVQQRPKRSGDRTRSSPTRTRTKNKTQLNAVSYFLLACVRGFELSPFPLNPHRKEVSATVFSLVTGKSQVFTIIFFFQFFSQI